MNIEALRDLKNVWEVIDKKQWWKDGSRRKVLDECFLLEATAEKYCKEKYGDDWADWVLIIPILIKENIITPEEEEKK